MFQQSLPTLLLLSGMLLTYWACKTTESSFQNTALDKTHSRYYQQLSGNDQRLLALRTGLFVQYADTEEGLSRKSISGDSVFLYSHPIGEVDRYGYWVLQQQFLAGIPEEPLTLYLEHFKRINRDSFVSMRCSWPFEERPSFLQLSDPNYKIEQVFPLDSVLGQELQIVAEQYKRQEHEHFIGWTDTMHVHHPEFKEKYDFKHLITDYRPLRTTTTVEFLSDQMEVQGQVKVVFIRQTRQKVAQLRARYIQRNSD